MGPIPARAGEPSSSSGGSGRTRAYPRSRGGTVVSPFKLLMCEGLSPLARGNQRLFLILDFVLGPIPARAGEPL